MMSGSDSNDNKSPPGTSDPPNLNDTKDDRVFHAVYIPINVSIPSEEPLHVYTTKLDALEVIKKHRNARFKSFNSKSEAEEYAKYGSQESNGSSNAKFEGPIFAGAVTEEKPSPFKGPKSQELVIFRKLIEEGDLDAVTKQVWDNPRYLISSGDTPAILKEGCRYNALHIATSKSKKNSEMCKLILDTVGDPDFVGLLYGKDECKTYVDRAQILLDLYLNTPDKGLNETPLHFAVKYGLKDVVKILVSYSECQKNTKNKYDQTPMEIICSRKCQENELLKQEIRALLEDQYYVPVLRSEDMTLQPTIGDPFSPTSPPRLYENPISPRMEVKAFAGPMSKPQAVEFKKKWKTPPRKLFATTPTRVANVSLNDSFSCLTNLKLKDPGLRLQDVEKGLESVGRDLAEECQVPWKEFWPFLNDFTDLRGKEGLDILEKYLIKREDAQKRIVVPPTRTGNNENGATENLRPIKKALTDDFVDKLGNISDKLKIKDEKSNEKSLDDMDILVKRMEMCSLNRTMSSNNSDYGDDEFFTPPDTPQSISDREESTSEDEMFIAEEGTPVFIEGDKPKKTDFAVLNALPDVINPDEYPFIYKWKLEMQGVMRNDNNLSFRTPKRRLLLTPDKPFSPQLNNNFEKQGEHYNFNH